jgi:hypothetical protein
MSEPGQCNRYSESPRTGRSADRISAGARYSATVQTDTGAHPASYIMGSGSLPAVKRTGRDLIPPPPSSAEVKKNSGAIPLHLLCAFMASHSVKYIFTFLPHISYVAMYRNVPKNSVRYHCKI